MTLADNLNRAQPTEPSGQVEVGPDGGEFSNVTTDHPITDWADIFTRFNLDPNQFAIVDDTVRMSMWQQSKRLENGDRDIQNLYSYRARFTRRMETIELPALYAAAARTPRKPLKPATSGRTTVVVLSDVQTGKVGSRGGTHELIGRLAEKRAKLTSWLTQQRPERTILAEAGDLFEGFESGGNPMFTNDLSLAQQMDLAGTEVFEFVKLMHRHGPVDVMTVSSNHTAWRRGKVNLGRPADDLGLHVHRTVEKLAHASGIDATWHYPAEYDESICIPARKTRIGMVHGNQYGPGRAIDWWAKQVHGGQAVADADILIGGHYHCLRVEPTGRNRAGRKKWFLQAPTLDSGSDWFRNIQGDDSDPGLLVFDVTDDGFDLQSLTVL